MRVCFHVLFSSFAMAVFWFSTNQRLDWSAAMALSVLTFVSVPILRRLWVFCVAFS